jgi:hypothetical protein
MKLFDTLLGRTELRKPKIEALFALSTAHISLEALGFKPTGVSGICFKPIESSRFSELENYLRELLRLSASETGTMCQFQTDEYSYNWVILNDKDFEDLVTTTHLISETIIEHGFEERLLCSIFSFRLRSAMEGELPIEKEMEKWHPFWGIPFQGRVLNAAKR